MDRLKTRFEETRNVAFKNPLEASASSLSRSEWRKPPSQCIRINTVAAVKGGTSMVGIVARDQQMEIQKIKAVKCCSNIPEVAEAFGILQGMKLAKEEGWNKIWCESDARNIVTSINNPDAQISHWAAAGIISDIVQLKSEFQEAHLMWIPREKNFLAHFVSNWAVKNGMCGVLSLSPVPFPFL
ncbi:uncharacterized protein LOC125418436 [Ziziphus jujuba]|uniref:Uncharacterized protein LOC125418436 n=1 Tax=Ziziphus jujuba TaxID=326968 RepID=A0ABM3I082_ZIZJJ|nr:uncharacterized protein LOC125418436 [Ziziphus jujuba]